MRDTALWQSFSSSAPCQALKDDSLGLRILADRVRVEKNYLSESRYLRMDEVNTSFQIRLKNKPDYASVFRLDVYQYYKVCQEGVWPADHGNQTKSISLCNSPPREH